MMRRTSVYSLALLLSCTSRLCAQAAFRNLDFESAKVAPIPAGQFGSFVPITNAIPYWTGYLGTNQVTQVLQNSFTLGDAGIDLYGPYFDTSLILQGQYTVFLQAGRNPFGSGGVNAALAQVGLVPANAKSILLEVDGTNFEVSFGLQAISLSPVGSGPNYTLYRGDISAFAGQSGELRVSTLETAGEGILFDAISFSTQSIPEPSALSLLLVGIMGLVFWAPKNRKTM